MVKFTKSLQNEWILKRGDAGGERRQSDGEGRPLPHLTGEADLSLMAFDRFRDDVQAETRAPNVLRGFGAEERLDLGNADAGQSRMR